jgi:hypothetical protein
MRGVLRTRTALLGALAVLLGAPAVLGLPSGAFAAAPISQSFTTPGEQQFIVPPGVTSVQVTAVGGNGGPGNGVVPGGTPGTVTATLAVATGQTLYAEVAGNGQGTNTSAAEEGRGGYGGGGVGGERIILFAGAPGGGGGGGASDVRTCPASAALPACGGQTSLASRLIVAGGGGGGGGIGLPTGAGGNGGPADLSGFAGMNDSQGDPGGSAGTRGTAAAAGIGGSPSLDCAPATGEGCGANGQPGAGGNGGEAQGGGGGGGGGGLFGGGGGGGGMGSFTGSGASLQLFNGAGGGGGGGASGVPSTAVGVSGFSLQPTAEGAQPSVTFTWTPPPPAVATGPASAITATTTQLGGTVNPNDWQITSCGFEISPAPAGISTIPCAQQLGSGGTPVSVLATATGLTPHTAYTVTLLAASIQGASSGETVTFATAPSSPSCECAGPLPTPRVSALKVSPSRFHRGRQATKLVASRAQRRKPSIPLGTTISFELSTPANVKLSFQRALPGQISGHACIAASSRRHPVRRCTRYIPVAGMVSLVAQGERNSIRFQGTLDGNRRLTPGSYRLTLAASNAAGYTTAAQHPAFTLLP